MEPKWSQNPSLSRMQIRIDFWMLFWWILEAKWLPKWSPRPPKIDQKRWSNAVLDAEAVQDLILDGFWTIFGWILGRIFDGFWMILTWSLDAGRFLLLAFMCCHIFYMCSVTFCCAAFWGGLLYYFPVGGWTSNQLTISRVVLGVLSCVLLRYVMLPLVLSFQLCCAVVCSVAFCCAVWVRLRTVRKDLFEFLFIVQWLQKPLWKNSVRSAMFAKTSIKNSVAAFRFLSSRFRR